MQVHRLHARCACAGSAGPFVLAGTERKYERSRPFGIRHLDLSLSVDLDDQSIGAVAKLSFYRRSKDATELALDAVGFSGVRVKLDLGKGPKVVEATYDGDKIVVPVPASAKEGKVEVAYRAKPKRGLYFLAPDAQVPDRPKQLWSQCQDEDARHWFPCHDKPHEKMTTAVTVRVPRGYRALSNGDLVSEQIGKRDKEWTYRFAMKDPVPSYLVTLVVGEFDVVEDRAVSRPGRPDVPIAYYVPKGRKKDALRAFKETPRMVELFGKVTGAPYPWSRYSQVVVKDFIFGGMENTTATTLYEHVLFDERAAVDVTSNDLIAHELAHHWFGDYVTCRDWSHAWLNEGFATYFEQIEREDRLGLDEYEYGIEADQSAYLGEAGGRYQRPIVCRDYEEPIDLFDRHLYEKGALVLHMLRRELGDDSFFAGIRLYLERHGGGIVETNDLVRAFEETSGRSLEQFFDQWVFRPGHPVLKVQVAWDKGLLDVRVKQSQKTAEVPLFGFWLEIEVATKAGKLERHKKWIDAEADALVVPLSDRPKWVGVDPAFRVVGSVTVEAPADLLRNALAHGTTARLRWMAARSMDKRTDPETVAALAAALAKKTETWMVRVEAARALGKIRGKDAFAALASHQHVAHPKVRRAVMNALGEFRTDEAAEILAVAAKKDESYLVGADAARSLGETRRPKALRTLVSVLGEDSWADVKRAAALDGLAALRDEKAVPEVLERTRYGHPTPARRSAVAALASLSDDRKVREHLQDLLDDHDPHFRISVVRALEALGDGRARGALRRALDREMDGRVARRIREALRSLSDRGGGDAKRLKDELEQLRRDFGDLKIRLSKLEQAKKPTHHKKGRAS